MRRWSRCVILSSLVVIAMSSPGFAQPRPKTMPRAPLGTEVPSSQPAVPDDPVIREFSGPLHPVVQGNEITVRWRTEPGPGGSPITAVTMVAPYLPEEPLRPTDERRFLFLGADLTGERAYRLTVRNGAGRSASRTLNLRQLSIRDALEQMDISLHAVPQEFKAGQPIRIEIGFSNREGPPLVGINIDVMQGDRAVGRLTNVAIGHRTTSARLRLPETGFTATAGEYIVNLEYRGVHRSKRYRTASVPYYTLVVVP